MVKIIRNRDVAPSSDLEVTCTADPEALVKAQAQHEQFKRNCDWLDAHGHEVYTQHRGKHICVAGRELFVADTAAEALALAKAAHPDDKGCYLRYIPKEKLPRIYAN